MIRDQLARKTALDLSRSFIVQAPAGSGKTELLIQRYLALLGSVEIPEEIVAITFTRKAAAEMRHRVIGALKQAKIGNLPVDDHKQETFRLAIEALAKNNDQDWQLFEQPQRLKIETLDALNLRLAHQLPILSGGISGSKVIEDNHYKEFYSSVSRRLVQQLDQETAISESLAIILKHLNVSVARLQELLENLLGTRDQWLQYITVDNPEKLIIYLEKATQRLIDDELKSIQDRIPHDIMNELIPLLGHAASHAKKLTHLIGFQAWLDLEKPPEPRWKNLAAWQALPELLLTQAGEWRKRLSSVGFSSKDEVIRDRLKDVISECENNGTLLGALKELADLPRPVLDSSEKLILNAFSRVLVFLAAELKLVFEERNTVDFTEIGLAAKAALGDTSTPSDLLLALDRRIQHLLVDEFQDTSQAQLRLLELLTSGWQQQDGRTLFLVGDPMQSIYRFRNAEMSLFLNTQRYGLGDIICESLILETNFRSSPSIVNWINQTFTRTFPRQDDLKAGAAKFSPCVPDPSRSDSVDEEVKIHALRGNGVEAEVVKVGEILAEEYNRFPNSSVAVLVRNRKHLTGLMDVLKPLGLPVHAVEIEAPNQQQITQDLIGLTRGLTHLGDRIAWLSILRAPWCGLTLRDLQDFCSDDRKTSIWELMGNADHVERLGENGKERLLRTRGVLELAFQMRGAFSMASWVERTWNSLGGPECLDSPEGLAYVSQFFLRLSKLDVNSDVDNAIELENYFASPRRNGDSPEGCGIEIMTIHRAKGLQFDAVVLLGLGKEPGRDSGRGLYWLERFDKNGIRDVLLGAPTSPETSKNSLTEWLKKTERTRDISECARLLYVATTRARSRLHLVAQLSENKKPDHRSLLGQIWGSVSEDFERSVPVVDKESVTNRQIVPVLRRLEKPLKAPEISPKILTPTDRPEFSWAGQSAVHVGTVVHQWLHRIAEDGLKNWCLNKASDNALHYRRELRLLGVRGQDLRWATERVVRALIQVLEDPQGRWILQSHPKSDSELKVTMIKDGLLRQLRLDRTFIDEVGTRWIIDYKTSSHEGGGKKAFLESEVIRYRSQLENYARAISQMGDRNIRVGLYFPLLQTLESWEPDLNN